MKLAFETVFWIVFGYFLLVNLYYFGMLVFSWLENRWRTHQEERFDTDWIKRSEYGIPVSVVVAAYNEEALIEDAVGSVLRNEYPLYEVIVVNDGSTDRTLSVLKEAYDLYPATVYYRKSVETKPVKAIYRSRKHANLVVIDKENGGNHADTANAGLNLAKYRYVLNLDGDSILEADALLRVMREVQKNPAEVVGVGSTIGISNDFQVNKGQIVERAISKNILLNFQVLEYLRAFFVNRLGWSRSNVNMCVSGAFSLWRRDILIAVGGFQNDFSCDDLELTYRVHRYCKDNAIPYQILSLPDPLCWTEAPASVYPLYQQRNRWQRVTNEVAVAYKQFLFRPRYGRLGWLGAPYMFIAEVLGPWMEFIGYLMIPLAWLLGYLDAQAIGYFLLASAGLTSLLSMAAIALFDTNFPLFKRGDVFRLAVVSAAEFLGYRQLISVARVMGTVDYFRGEKAWNKFKREKTLD